MNELKARPSYAKENWLVVIASNKGGVSAASSNGNAYDDTRRNSFVIYYNPQFSTQPIIKPDVDSFPYAGFAPSFISTASSTGTATLSNTALGNFGTAGDYTIMFKIKYNGTAATSFPLFLSKRDATNKGWHFLFGTTNIQFAWTGASTISNPANIPMQVKDGIWHSLAIKIYMSGANRTATMFFDGKLINSTNIQARDVDNTVPITMGSLINTNTNMLIKDFAIYNVSMPDAELIDNMRRQLTTTSPYFANLLGWWPADEASGTIIADLSGKGNNFTTTGVTRTQFEDRSPNISPLITTASYRSVINSVDIPIQIYQWMGISPQANWGLDGKVWRILYKDVRNN